MHRPTLLCFAGCITTVVLWSAQLFAAQSDLIIESISHAPAEPTPGTLMAFTVVVKNQGTLTAIASNTAFWSHLDAAPTAGEPAQQILPTLLLAPGATIELSFPVVAPQPGSYKAWAFADKSALVLESNETNNAGPAAGHAWTVVPVVIPPTIASALTATATRNQSFTYTVTATGTAPITFAAEGLPPGLVFAVDTITGEATQAGSFNVALTASNVAGSDAKTLQLTVSAPDTGTPNNPPVINSLPQAAPNPALAGQTVSFATSASDADNDALTYVWNFGDGTTGNGSSTTHVYAAPGVYSVELSVTDGRATENRNLLLVINSEATTAPAGTGKTPNVFHVQKASLRINLKLPNKDKLSLSGTLPVKNLAPAGKTLRIQVGGVDRSLALDAKGKASQASQTFKLLGRQKDGIFTVTPVKFSFSFKNQALLVGLTPYIFDATSENATIHVPVVLSMDNADWQVDFVKFKYNPKTGAASQAKATR